MIRANGKKRLARLFPAASWHKGAHGMERERGAVSVFLAIVIAALFFFHTVLLDFARVKMGEIHAENAVQSALRSVLSAYDAKLKAYGLFALADEQQAKRIFAEVMDEQLKVNGDSGNLVNVSWHRDTLRMESGFPLSDHQVLRQQILEEMKYKAPIEFMFFVWDAFKDTGLAADAADASLMQQRSETMEELRRNREQALDRAWAKAEELGKPEGKLDRLSQKYARRLQDLEQLAREIGGHTQEEVRDMIRRNKEQRERLEERLEESEDPDRRSELKSEIRELKEEYEELKELLENILTYISLLQEMREWQAADYSDILSVQRSIHNDLSAAKQANEALKEAVNTQMAGQREGSFAETYQQLLTNMEVLDPSYFYSYEAETGKIAGMFSGFKQLTESQSLLIGREFASHLHNLYRSNEQYAQQGRLFYQRQLPVETERKRRNEDIERQKKEQTAAILEQLRDLRTLVADCEGREGRPAYERLNGGSLSGAAGLFAKYERINGGAAGAVNEFDETMWEDPEKIGRTSLRFTERVKTALLAVRDQAYLHEFALSKFNYRTQALQSAADMLPGNAHILSGQEAEYILYGFGSCPMNQGAAFGEIFLIRLAVNMMDVLADPHKAWLNSGSPLLFMLYAAAEGAVRAAADMKELVAGKALPLAQRFHLNIQLTYKDYLRVLYLIHHDGSKMLSRIQALIELNTNADLAQRPTEIQTTLTASLRLWFVPGAMKLTGHKTAERREVWQQTAVMAY
jgi:hypothetical protein